VPGLWRYAQLPGLYECGRSSSDGYPQKNDVLGLSAEQVDYYRRVLVAHATTSERQACAVCGVPRCPDWLNAFDTLAAAHQVMTGSPTPWEPFHPGSRPTRRA
jgi:hypothetical protein